MAYEYREVKCPWCDHVFMWCKNAFEGLIIHEYRLKETKELVGKAKCPNCSMEMVVLDHLLEGVDVKDDRVEAVGVRGI